MKRWLASLLLFASSTAYADLCMNAQNQWITCNQDTSPTAGVTTGGAATLTNKTISGASNTLTNIGPASVLSTVGESLAIGGTADDTAAVQAVINALPSSGAVLTFQPGQTYSIGAAGLTFSSFTNLTINFNGAQLVALTDTTQQSVSPFYAVVVLHSCTNCEIYGGNFNGGGFRGAFIGLDSCTDTKVHDNISSNVSGVAAIFQFVSTNGIRNVWERNIAYAPGGVGTVGGFGLGGTLANQIETDLIVRHNKALNGTRTGFSLSAVGSQVEDNYSNGNAGSGFLSAAGAAASSANNVYVGNTAVGNLFHGFQTDVPGAGTVLNLTVTGNNFSGNTIDGILLESTIGATVVGNTLDNNGGVTTGTGGGIGLLKANNVTIGHNQISISNTALGISFASTANVCNDIVIDSNIFVLAAASQYAIRVQAVGASASLNGINIANNDISGGAIAIYLQADTAGGVMGDIRVVANTVTGQTGNAYWVRNATAGQITGLKMIGNAGAAAVFDGNTVFAYNIANDWNGGTTGTGALVFGTAPTLTLPNATGLPLTTGVSGVLPAANGGFTATDVQVFTSTGTWTKPGGSPIITRAIAIGSGGGGGGGPGVTLGTAESGGGGGGGGATTEAFIPTASLSGTETVTVAVGGTSGAGSASSPGSTGGAGNPSTFGTTLRVRAFGGGAGAGGATSANSGGGGGGGGAIVGGNGSGASAGGAGNGGGAGGTGGQAGAGTGPGGGGGGGGTASAAGGNGGGANQGATGGGAGGGLSTTTAFAGGSSGNNQSGSFASGGAATGAPGTTPATPAAYAGGIGGGGGGANASGTGGVGATGGTYGGGAGGGGASAGGTGGAGGVGGAGLVVVITYY